MSARDSQRCRDAVRLLADRWSVEQRNAEWRDHRYEAEDAGAPVLHFEDVSAIPFVSGIGGVEEYQHRARVRAHDGDLYVCVTEPAVGYERYCREHLRLGSPDFVLADPTENPCAVARAALGGQAFEQLVAAAARSERLVLHPYMAMEDAWVLARSLADASGARVSVLGPPPAATWAANDKALFSDIVAATAGDAHLVETRRETTVDGLAAALRDLAHRHPMVGIKRTRCASAMGNKVLRGAEVRQMSEAALRERVTAFLEHTEWPAGEEVLAVEWVVTDLSPSTQIWIPLNGEPVCEGVYEQLLEGEEKCFLGSRPSTLPAAVNAELERTSVQVAAGFQALGYVGRASFDFVVGGDPQGEFTTHFTECNGRWGGTSTPMYLVDRLIDGPRPAYVAQDWVDDRFVGLPFTELERCLGDDLFDPATGTGRFVLYNVGPLKRQGKFDVIALGDDAEDAWNTMRVVLPSRLARL